MTKKLSILLPTLILFIFLIFPAQSFSQSGKSLAVKGNYTLTEDHVQFYVKLLQFVVGQKIKNSEVGEIRNQAIGEFNKNPQSFFTELNQFYSFMSQLYQQTDPLQIANGRMYFISQFYKLSQATPKKNLPSLIRISNRYVKVLHYNPQTQIALTNKDITAVLEYADFSRQLNGYPALSYAEKQNFQKYLPKYYSKLSTQQQAVFVIMPIVWKQIEWQWQRLTPQQKQQAIAQHRAKNMQQYRQPYPNSSAGNYRNRQTQRSQSKSSSLYQKQLDLQRQQDMFNIMQNMNQNSHITSLNIIENMGNSGNYWTLQNQNY